MINEVSVSQANDSDAEESTNGAKIEEEKLLKRTRYGSSFELIIFQHKGTGVTKVWTPFFSQTCTFGVFQKCKEIGGGSQILYI